MNKLGKYFVWIVFFVMGVFVLGYIVLNCGEQINVLWIVVVLVCIYLIVYCFYGLYIVKNVLVVDLMCMMLVVCYNDGLDYVLMDKKVLFGYYFVVIVGVGLLVGLVLVV